MQLMSSLYVKYFAFSSIHSKMKNLRYIKYLFAIAVILLIKSSNAQSSIGSLISNINDAKELKDTLSISRAYYKLGIFYDKQEELNKSNEALTNALFFANKINSVKAIPVISNYLAGNYSEQGKQEEAIALYKNSYEGFLSIQDTVNASSTLLNLGTSYLDMGSYEKAIETQIEALKLRELTKDSTNIAIFFQSIGEVYKALGMVSKWREYLTTAKRISENPEYAAFNTQIAILNDVAGFQLKDGEYLEALKSYREMYSLAEQHKYTRGMNVALTNLSDVYLQLNDYTNALDAATQSYKLSIQENNIFGITGRCNQIGNVYLTMNNGYKAEEWYNKALSYAENKYPNEILISYSGLFEANKITDNYKNSVAFSEKYIVLKDSMETLAVKEKVAELETIYQSEKKEAQITHLNQENIIQQSKLRMMRLYIWGIVLVVLFILSVIYLLYRQQKLKTRNNEILLEQKLLRSQMNPHFIFNSLGAIQNFMYKNENKKASFYLGSFATLMRSVLNHSREELISLKEEMETIQNYLELQKMRVGFSFKIICAQKINPEQILVPPMLVQPFIENAIKHGISSIGEKGIINVHFETNNERLSISVEDNGVGINSAQKINKTPYNSQAIKIFKERLSLLSSYFRKEIKFNISDKNMLGNSETGTLVAIELPLILD
jgi:tetratricopeptide (TPR) repeat protein